MERESQNLNDFEAQEASGPIGHLRQLEKDGSLYNSEHTSSLTPFAFDLELHVAEDYLAFLKKMKSEREGGQK